MKMKHHLLSLGLIAGLGSSFIASAQGDRPAVEVEFQQPDEFTDLTSEWLDDRADPGYLEELRRHIERTASNRLAPGQRLRVTITDIDMAGDFEPERGAQNQDVRIVKSIYPPRIDLTFTLTDAVGNVLEQGERKLRDQAFDWNIRPTMRNDPLRHEKTLLDDFIRNVTRSGTQR